MSSLAVEALLSLGDDHQNGDYQNMITPTRSSSRLRKRKIEKIEKKGIVHFEDLKDPNPKENDYTTNYTTTKNLILGKSDSLACRLLDTQPSILVEHHIDHLNHAIHTFSEKPEGYIVLVELVSFPKMAFQEPFIEYALLIKQKEGKWMLLFKRTVNDAKIYWDTEFLRDNYFRMDVRPNTIGGMTNFTMFLNTTHQDHVQKYLMTKPDKFKILVRTTLILYDQIKKIHRIIWKDGNSFHLQELVVQIDNEEIFWDKVYTGNMYFSKLNDKALADKAIADKAIADKAIA